MSAQCSVVNKCCWKLCTCTHFVLLMIIIITVFRCHTLTANKICGVGDVLTIDVTAKTTMTTMHFTISMSRTNWAFDTSFQFIFQFFFGGTLQHLQFNKTAFFSLNVNLIARACGRKKADARVNFIFDITNRHIRYTCHIASYNW